MDIFERRGITRTDLFLIFSACVLPVFLWAFYNLFYRIPGLLVRLNFSELVGSTAYVLAFALLESGLFFLVLGGGLLLAAVLLPRRWLAAHLAVIGSTLALTVAALVMVVQRYSDLLNNMSTRRQWFYLGLVGLALVVYYFVILRYPRVEEISKEIYQRLSILSILYVVLGLASVVLIVVRNLGS